MNKKYTDEFLISELHRFVRENNRNPSTLDMQGKFGYPTAGTYINHFGSWNASLKISNLFLNQYRLDGTETCSYCGKRADEIPNFGNWHYHDDIRYCQKHGNSGMKGIPDYTIGNLDINSNVGLGRAGEILVVKTLEIGKEHDCNRETCHAEIDMYNEKYGKIDVKTALFSYEYNSWSFDFNNKKEIKTYICIGLSAERSVVQHVWIIPNEGKIRNQQKLEIYDTQCSLSNREHWEVSATPYNKIWKTMKLKNCGIMINKKYNKN